MSALSFAHSFNNCVFSTCSFWQIGDGQIPICECQLHIQQPISFCSWRPRTRTRTSPFLWGVLTLHHATLVSKMNLLDFLFVYLYNFVFEGFSHFCRFPCLVLLVSPYCYMGAPTHNTSALWTVLRFQSLYCDSRRLYSEHRKTSWGLYFSSLLQSSRVLWSVTLLMLFCTFRKIRVALHNFLIMQSGMLSLSTKSSLVGCRNLVLVALDFCVDYFRVGSIPGPATVGLPHLCYTELPCVQILIWQEWLLCCVALLNTIALLC
jgi:hypothetical protein